MESGSSDEARLSRLYVSHIDILLHRRSFGSATGTEKLRAVSALLCKTPLASATALGQEEGPCARNAEFGGERWLVFHSTG
jgi:hypothetical protein